MTTILAKEVVTGDSYRRLSVIVDLFSKENENKYSIGELSDSWKRKRT